MTAVALLFSENLVQVVSADPTPNCQANYRTFREQCYTYYQKFGKRETPSEECCKAANAIDLSCICSFVDSDLVQNINMEAMVAVLGSCGKNIPSGHKCGSKYIFFNSI